MKTIVTITAIDAPTMPVPTGNVVEIVDRATGQKREHQEMRPAPMRAVYLTGKSWDSSERSPIIQSGDVMIVCTPEDASGIELGATYELTLSKKVV